MKEKEHSLQENMGFYLDEALLKDAELTDAQEYLVLLRPGMVLICDQNQYAMTEPFLEQFATLGKMENTLLEEVML